MNYDDLIQKAREYGSNQNWDKAIEFYEKAFNISIDTYDVLDLAICYLENNDSYKALSNIEFVINVDPEDNKGYFYKGIYFEHLEEKEEALKWYKISEEKGNIDPELYFKIGLIYDELSDIDTYNDDFDNIAKAKNYYLKALEIDDYHFYANLNLGSIYEKENELEKALKLSLKAYESNSVESYVCYNLGVIYSKLNKYDLALKYYLEETKRENPYPYVYYNLGIIYKDKKEYELSKLYYLEGLKYLKHDSSIWYNLGCVHALNNDFKNAFECFVGAITINSKIINYLEDDNELKEFIKSDEYNTLCNKYKK